MTTTKQILTTIAKTIKKITITILSKIYNILDNYANTPPNNQNKCQKCHKPSGKYKLCYQCWKEKNKK